jgi:hypothetical protein
LVSLVFLPASLVFLAAMAHAQPADSKTCSADGTVVNSVTGAPIQRAHIGLIGPEESTLVDSDAAGKWRAEHISCGRLTITVNRVGFLRSQQGIGAPQTFTLAADSPLHDVKLELAPQAVIAGRVLDDQGDPVQGAQISLMKSSIVNGVRGVQAASSAVSNDLGEYRFAGLAAGRYILCANAGGGVVAANTARPFGERCYPGPVDGGASSAMEVAAGYEGRVDFTLSQLATFNVSGAVSGRPEGANASVNLTPRTQIARMSLGLSAAVRPDGTFVIRNVPSGSYTASATWLQQSGRLFGRAPVDVGGTDVTNVQLHLEPGITVTGTIKAVSVTGAKLEKPQYNVMLRASDAAFGADQNSWNEDKTSFSINGVIPGSYRLQFSAPPPFYLKSATLGGRDIAGSDVLIGAGAENIEVVLRDDGGVIEGDVSADDGPAAAWIYLERDGAQPRNNRSDLKGHFKFDTIPPGDYRIYAWDDNSRVEYGNSDWMRRYGKPIPVTVQPGQTVTVKVSRQTAPVE